MERRCPKLTGSVVAMEKKRKIEAAHKALQLKIAMQKRKEREAILARKGKLPK